MIHLHAYFEIKILLGSFIAIAMEPGDELSESIAMLHGLSLTNENPRQSEIDYSCTILKLLLQAKHGDLGAAHQLEARAREFGERSLLHIAILLTSSTHLSYEERRNLQQVFDALLPLLGDMVSSHVRAIVEILTPRLASADPLDNEIGRQVVSNLTRYVGLDHMKEMVSPDLFGDNERLRRRAVQVLTAVTLSVGITSIIPFLRNACSESNIGTARETGFMVVQQIAKLNGHAIIPYLSELVQIAAQELSVAGSSAWTVRSAALAIDSMAEAVHPYGEYAFKQVMPRIFECMRSQLALNRMKSAEACAKAIESIVELTEEPKKSAYAKQLMEVLCSEARVMKETEGTAVSRSESRGTTDDIVKFDVLVMKMSRLSTSSCSS